MTTPQEQVIYSNGTVTVTQYRFVVESETYSIQNITSVRHEVYKPPQPDPPKEWRYGILWIVGIGLVAVAFALLRDDSSDGFEIALGCLLLVGAFAVLGGAALGNWKPDILPDWARRFEYFNRPKPTPIPLPTHTVTLTSAAQETKALSSTDEVFIREIIAALNNAIVLKG